MSVDREPINEEALDDGLRILDGFAHPQPDKALIAKVDAAIMKELRHRRRWSVVLRIGTPLAAAASIVLVIGLWWGLTSGDSSVDSGTGTVQYVDNAGNGLTEELDWLSDEITYFEQVNTYGQEEAEYSDVGEEIDELADELSL